MGLSRRSLCKIADLQKQRPAHWRESLFICLFLFLLISIDYFDIFWHKIVHGRVADRVCLALFQCFHYVANHKEPFVFFTDFNLCLVIAGHDFLVGCIWHLINLFDFLDALLCELHRVCGKISHHAGLHEHFVGHRERVAIGL